MSAAAAIGAQLLDQAIPGWAPYINKATLNMADPSQDVLAQLCHDDVLAAWRNHMAQTGRPITAGDCARSAAMAWHLSGLGDTKRASWSRTNGFLPFGDTDPTRLTADWLVQIDARLEAGAK